MLGHVKHIKGWVSYSRDSLYEVFYESGIHTALDTINQWMYGTKKSNFTVKTGRATPVKYKWERMELWNDRFLGN